VVRINMFPELIKASCSMLGAWGPALADPASVCVCVCVCVCV
jgi:hypothetical protein